MRGGASTVRGADDASFGQSPFQALDPLEQGDGRVVRLRVGQLDQCHLEMHPLVGNVAHVDLGPTQLFHGSHQRGQPHATGGVLHPGAVGTGQAHQLARHRGQETLAEVLGEIGGKALGVAPRLGRLGHGHERPARVTVGQGLGQLGQHLDVVVDEPAGGDLIERRQRVAGRSPSPAHRRIERFVGKCQAGGAPHLGAGPTAFRTRGGGTRNAGCGYGSSGSTFWGSVVASTNTTWPGGSSSVLSRALAAAVEHVDFVDDVDLPPAGVPRAAWEPGRAWRPPRCWMPRRARARPGMRPVRSRHRSRIARRAHRPRARRSSTLWPGCGPSTFFRCHAAR